MLALMVRLRGIEQGDAAPEVPVAESAGEDVSATIHGAVIGEIDGLMWEDASGVDIISVTIDEGQVAVPVDRGEWRHVHVLELGFEERLVKQAPLLGDLLGLTPAETIEQIAEHYSVNLGGPPPGPDPLPLPPWWNTGESQ